MLEILMAKDLLYAAAASMYVPFPQFPRMGLLKSFQNRPRAVCALNLYSQHPQRRCWCPNDLTASHAVLHADT